MVSSINLILKKIEDEETKKSKKERNAEEELKRKKRAVEKSISGLSIVL